MGTVDRLNDDVIRKHLEGAHVVGIYPMLQDEGCYFFAVDFDKEDWVDIGEGLNEPRLDKLFITMPISFKGEVVQHAGRLHRSYRGEEEIRIYDYVDKDVPVFFRDV
jgi:DNA/RNA endonuclease YhcR with UshA esterase domain